MEDEGFLGGNWGGEFKDESLSVVNSPEALLLHLSSSKELVAESLSRIPESLSS